VEPCIRCVSLHRRYRWEVWGWFLSPCHIALLRLGWRRCDAAVLASGRRASVQERVHRPSPFVSCAVPTTREAMKRDRHSAVKEEDEQTEKGSKAL
jgi:hypothetical protein